MKIKSEITIFLTIILLLILSFVCVSLEAGRKSILDWYFCMSADSSLDSLLSYYHSSLWEKYHLLFYPVSDEPEPTAGISEMLRYYYDTDYNSSQTAGTLFPLTLVSAELLDIRYAVDDDGIWLEKNAAAYMKNHVVSEVALSLLDGSSLLTQINKAREWIEQLEEHAKTIIAIETKVKTILDELNGLINSENMTWEKAEKVLEFFSPYEEEAAALKDVLDVSITDIKSEADQYNETVYEAILYEWESAGTYGDVASERYQDLMNWKQQITNYISTEKAKEEAVELEEQETSDNEQAVFENPFNSLRLSDWMEAMRNETTSIAENSWETISESWQGSFLSLVTDESAISSKSISTSGLPSSVYSGGSDDFNESYEDNSWTDSLLLKEYALKALSSFREPADSDASLAYELEYLLSGKASDRENLLNVVLTLSLLREGVNFIDYMTDTQKRSEAEAWASAIVGFTGCYAAVRIVSLAILAVWAYQQSLTDIKLLMNGESVSLFPKSFNTDVLSLDYEGYLRLLLYSKNRITTRFRVMDVIQWNIQAEDSGFLFSNMAAYLKIQVKATAPSVFTGISFLKKYIPSLTYSYERTLYGAY